MNYFWMCFLSVFWLVLDYVGNINPKSKNANKHHNTEPSKYEVECSSIMPKLIVCLVGMPGAGKSTIANGLASQGYDMVNMGDSIRAEATKRQIEPTSKNLGKIMVEMRSHYGPGAVAHLIKPQVISAQSDIVIVDGIRSSDEIRVLQECGVVKVLAIHASQDTRFTFLKKRKRSDDPDSQEMLQKRDQREMGIGISDPIALADESISNNNLDKNTLISTAADTIQRWRQL